MNIVIKVDFDGTLFEKAYPKIGCPKQNVIKLVKALKRAGHTIILDTCREGTLLEEAVSACAKHGLVFDYVNENSPERIACFGEDCRKISADYSIDDTHLSLDSIDKIAFLIGGSLA